MKRIIFCNCGSEIYPETTAKSVKDKLESICADVLIFSDFCALAATEREQITDLLNKNFDNLVIACHERAVKSIFRYINFHEKELSFSYLNVRNQTTDAILNKIDDFIQNSSQNHSKTEIKNKSEWFSWYPVIDYDRCTNCGQCADFCLFGVYTKTEQQVLVTKPDGCKTNCPACARICPHTAIIFPKYKEGGAISGAAVNEEAEKQRIADDLAKYAGNNIYQTLELRKAKRKSIIKEEALKKAMEEREAFLNKQK